MDVAAESSVNLSLTPMMRQWAELKAKAPESWLFFRLGDFYELFEQDAVAAAPVLGLTLTSRNSRSSNAAALCGVPASSVEHYLTKALDHGSSVALVEQLEEPSAGKVIVRRDIVQYFTPGIRLLKTDARPHYAATLLGNAQQWSLAAADVSTGHVVLESGQSLENLQEIIDRLPVEDLRTSKPNVLELRVKYQTSQFFLSTAQAEAVILESFQQSDPADSPARHQAETQALGTLFYILRQAHPRDCLRYLMPRTTPSSVWVSAFTRKNLSLFEPDSKNLFELLDRTTSAMGRRELRQILGVPTSDPTLLLRRQELVSFFKQNASTRKLLRSEFSKIYDIHRLLRKRRGPSQLFELSESLKAGIATAVNLSSEHPDIEDFQRISVGLSALSEKLSRSLQASHDSELGWIARNVSSTLDELRELKENAARLLSELEEKLRTELKVSSLKIKFHQVFGYVAELTSTHRDKIPARAKRIQTLANSERFKVEELELLEEKILSLDSRIREAEKAEVGRLFDFLENYRAFLLDWADAVGKLDVFQSLAEVSEVFGWTRPKTLETEVRLQVTGAVHPLSNASFVPLDFCLDSQNQQIFLITGPNMSGKSTLLRCAAIIALLHQIGSDVPAKTAELGLFDRIGCRMGASDDISSGQSTFYLEMREVASMLHGATERSLLLFDEIGRGTSTFDGMSLAWSITEAVHELGALSFIATHYIELSELENILSRLHSFHLGIKEVEGNLLFTRRLQKGPASRSYGIHVAKLAGISSKILERADKKLHEFEKRRAKPISLLEMMSGPSS